MPLNVVEALDSAQIEQLHRLYQREWWTRGRSLEETALCIQGSQLCIGLADEYGELQAFTRVITDFIFKALVLDVIVAQAHRGRGLGDRLLELISKHPSLSRVKHFELYCQDDLCAFYENHGYSREVGGIRFMRRLAH